MKRENSKLEQLRQIYGMMNHILWQIEASDHYNYIPGTEEDGWDYFGAEIAKIEETAQNMFLGDRCTLDRLEQIIKELLAFVRSYSTPGVVQRWREINSRLNYFDAVYTAIEEEPETYLSIKRRYETGESYLHFEFCPTLDEVLEKNAYFALIQKENKDLNFRFSEERIFQNEVVKTLELVMLHDFPELQISERTA